ncbi:MAG: hypothetical protein ACFFD1_02360 [Candidatus Thorarchaeota archaeon]
MKVMYNYQLKMIYLALKKYLKKKISFEKKNKEQAIEFSYSNFMLIKAKI